MRTPFGLRFPIADVERWSAKYSYVERKEGLEIEVGPAGRRRCGSEQRLRLVAADLIDIDAFARQLSPRYDRSISCRTATIGAWSPRIEIAAAPA